MAIFSGLIALLGVSGFAGAVTIFGLSPALSAAIIGIGRAVLYSAISGALAPKAKVPRQQVQAVVNQGLSPRIRAYGQVKLGGVRAFFEAKAGVLYQVVVCHHGPLSSVIGWEVDGRRVSVDADGDVAAGRQAGFMRMVADIDGVRGGVWPAITAAFPTLWDASHSLQGQSTFYVRMRLPKLSRLSKVFPRQAQTTVQLIARGSSVLDVRTGVTGYSDNAALAIHDYLTHPDGYRVPVSRIDQASFSDFANRCDEAVVRKSGSTERRYRIGGYYSLEDQPKDTLARMLLTCDGQLYIDADGKIAIMGGAWSTPDVTIYPDDIYSMTISDGTDPFTDFNILKGNYVDPANSYQETECAELRDDVALLTQETRVETVEADMVPSPRQMQRLLKIIRAKRLRRYTGTIETNLVGLKLRFPKGDGIHTFRIVNPELSIDAIFEVTSHNYSIAEKRCVIGIASIENPYEWDAATEEGIAPRDVVDMDVLPDVVPTPTGLTLAQEIVRFDQQSQAVRIVAQVDPAPYDALQVEMQYRDSTDPAAGWQAMIVARESDRGYSAVLDDQHAYQVRARWIVEDDWSPVQTITTVANPVLPAVPTAFAGVVAGADVNLSWTNASAGFYQTRVFRSVTNDFAASVLVASVSGVAGQVSRYTDTPGPGTWRYWVRTVNPSLVTSLTAGPVTITV
jgi:hypothetical protein